MQITDDDVGRWFLTRGGDYAMVVEQRYTDSMGPYPYKIALKRQVFAGRTFDLTETVSTFGTVYPSTQHPNDLVERITDPAELAELELTYGNN